MSKWVIQREDTQLPDWLKANLRETCKCGGLMENYYNDRGDITSRRCSNTKCPYRLAQKIVGVCDILEVKGIGPERALSLVQNYNLSTQYQAISHILKDKPTVSLYNFLRMSFIKGVDTGWSEVANKCTSLDECYTKYVGNLSRVLVQNRELLYDGLQYVNILQRKKQKFKPILTGTVMISGTLRGYENRNQYIAILNYASQGLINLSISESKRKTGILALIQEKDAPMRGKAECALQNGIPIMDPEQFSTFIQSIITNAVSKGQVEVLE